MIDKQDPRYWTSIKDGDFITLTDYQSIALAGEGGQDYRVKNLRPIEIPDADSGRVLAEYRIYELEAGEGALLFFAVVGAGDEFELRTYYLPRGFTAGTRDRLVDLGQTWFFLPPPDPEDFVSSQLEYAPYPDLPAIEENGVAVKREYEPGGFGRPAYGTYRIGSVEIPVIVVEYITQDTEALNPLILVLEERWILPDGSIPPEGGLVIPLLGCVVRPDSVETYPGT